LPAEHKTSRLQYWLSALEESQPLLLAFWFATRGASSLLLTTIFEDFVRNQGLEFAPIAGNFQELLQSEEGQKLLTGQKQACK